ncbi:amidophosphoribosyltransferase [Sporosarcina sp. P12(2017)]|uniref:ComF family protein n=1 Tax=unclassified Sporosarcina TaxID=2647733 RepID=UPI000C171DCC|nr:MULTISPECIES: phosphoribosyltransferase family protein [unclassified Sporosarcina]PIC56251.1 amidophosphoribosyltransferase [Sporosarcina sp. P10]PIC59495.1 amidophosphoribosyltransferase [Sporosarcina sp. P12(2017)]
MTCLLCDQSLHYQPTWQHFLGIQKDAFACPICFEKFERIDQIIEDDVLDSVHSLYAYNEAGREYLHQFKFMQDVALAQIFAPSLRSVLNESQKIVVPIPMHPINKRKRTFSQVDALLEAAKIPYQSLLEKTTESVMGEKSRSERLAMTELFHVTADIQRNEAVYVLVDDIYTTGTTLRHAAEALKQRGVQRVEAVTLFRPIREK